MIAHHVLFWLKPGTSEAERAAFKKGLESLEAIETITHLHAGTPAPIDRPVIDTTYTFSLVLFFKDLQGHDVYQVHPLHKAFLDEFRGLFEKVIIYDAQS